MDPSVDGAPSRRSSTPLARTAFLAGCLVIVFIGVYFRSAGLWRGLDHEVVFHPDSPKQIMALQNYLHGRPVWYMDNLFYDGYPYGLNVVDKWIITAVYAVARPVAQFLDPAITHLEYPGRGQLHYWANLLRVLYGVAVLILTLVLAHGLTQSRRVTLLAGIMAAIAPLSATVTHSATGDIGVDLFVTLAVAILVLSLKCPRSPFVSAVLLAGASTGLAFGCKYQGALGLFIIGAYVLLTLGLSRGGAVLRVAGLGIATLLVTLAAIYCVTPALHVHWKSAWRNILLNFEFIQNYSVSREFLSLPLWKRVGLSLSGNLPYVMGALGGLLFASYLAGLAESARQLWGAVRGPLDLAVRRRTSLLLAIALFPLFAVLVSTALKPEVQPFHFAYLVPLLCVVAAIGLQALFHARRPGSRLVAVLLAAGTLLQLGAAARTENFFWKRDDIQVARRAYAEHAFRQPLTEARRWCQPREQVLKVFRVENADLSAFRNSRSSLLYPAAPFWNAVHVIPGPTLPMHNESGWVFASGPLLPRDDRTFKVEAGRTVDRAVAVYDSTPAPLVLGIRSGALPVELRIEGLGGKWVCRLDANRQTLLPLPDAPRGIRIPPDRQGAYGGRILTIRCRALVGSAWVSILGDPRELDNFALTGGVTNRCDNPALAGYSRAEIAARADDATFLDSKPMSKVLSTNALEITDGTLPLPAGRYCLDAVLAGRAATNAVAFRLSDRSGAFVNEQGVSLAPGTGRVSLRFEKPFDPYLVAIQARCTTGDMVLLECQLRPDTRGILADLDILRQGGAPAGWMQPAPSGPVMEETRITPVDFGGKVSLISCSLPPSLTAGSGFSYNVRLRIRDYETFTVEDAGVFMHLENGQGKAACSFFIPLEAACYETGRMVPVAGTIPRDLPAGEYQVCMGLYSPSIRKRWHAEARGYTVRNDSVRVGAVSVTRAPSGR